MTGHDGDPGRAAPHRVAVIGAGPAGLMACEALAAGGAQVDLFDAMPSVGRKFLLAGIGGLNLTHSEPLPAFMSRYAERASFVQPWLDGFGPQALRDWAGALGIETFIGTSGRVFPRDMKAAPLLRAWLHRLRVAGVTMHQRHRWLGWAPASDGSAASTMAAPAGSLRFATPSGERSVDADAVVLALGGASWPRLGSDGAWVPWLRERGVDVAPLRPANCGFDVGWSEHFKGRYAGSPVKPVTLSHLDSEGRRSTRQGEFVVTAGGIEGSLVYAFSAALRDQIEATGEATVELDLLPAHDAARVLAEVLRPRGPRSLSTHLKSRLGLHGAKAGLLWELLPEVRRHDAAAVAASIKALPLKLLSPRPLAEAISSAGGVRFEAMDERSMLKACPGVFCAGEMIDWEAPTGGYLLTAAIGGGRHAGIGALQWLSGR